MYSLEAPRFQEYLVFDLPSFIDCYDSLCAECEPKYIHERTISQEGKVCA